jgi:hypothetical protein
MTFVIMMRNLSILIFGVDRSTPPVQSGFTPLKYGQPVNKFLWD